MIEIKNYSFNKLLLILLGLAVAVVLVVVHDIPNIGELMFNFKF